MKKILILLLTLISFGCVAQNNPANWRNGIETKFMALDTLTTAQRDALTLKASKGYVVFNSDTNVLNVHDGSTWSEVGSSGVPYTGATTDVDLGENDLTSQFLYSEGQPSGNTAGALLLRYDTAITSPLNYISLSASSQYRFRITTDDDSKGVMFDMSGITAFSPRILTIPDLSGTIALTSQLATAGTDDQTASEVAYTPYLTIGSTDTQSAINELKDERDVTHDLVPNSLSYSDATKIITLNQIGGGSFGVGLSASFDKKIAGDTTGLENVALKPINRAVLHDYSIDPTLPTLSAGDISFTINAPLAIGFTGTVIPLDDYYQHDDSGTDTATWTLAGSPQNGALVEILINEASEPTITGATQFSNSPAFIAATPMILTVKHILGTTYYFFTEL